MDCPTPDDAPVMSTTRGSGMSNLHMLGSEQNSEHKGGWTSHLLATSTVAGIPGRSDGLDDSGHLTKHKEMSSQGQLRDPRLSNEGGG